MVTTKYEQFWRCLQYNGFSFINRLLNIHMTEKTSKVKLFCVYRHFLWEGRRENKKKDSVFVSYWKQRKYENYFKPGTNHLYATNIHCRGGQTRKGYHHCMERAILCALWGLDNFGKQHFPPPLTAFLLRSVWNWWYIFYSELTTRNKHFDWLHQGLAHMCTLLPAYSVSDRFASWKCKWLLLKKMGLRLLEKPSFSVPWTWFLCPSVRTCMCEPVLCRQQGFGWKECGKKYLVPSVKQNPCQKWGTFHLQRGKFLGRNHARFCRLKMDCF